MSKILFVEDDKGYRDNIVHILENAHYEVIAVENAIDAIEVFPDHQFDLVITDFQMEGMDGLRFLKYVKKIEPEMRTMILTGVGSGDTEIAAITNEVDQYLDKNVRLDVFLKYVEILLKKEIKMSTDEKILKSEAENIEVNIEKRTVTRDGKPVHLTEKEFKILCYMLENKGYALSREDIIDNIWDVTVEDVDLRAVDSHVKAVRKKIQTVSIASIRGYGYKWSE